MELVMTKKDSYPFSDTILSLPSKFTPTRDKKSSKAADVHVMLTLAEGVNMEVVTAVWATPERTAEGDAVAYSVGLPRGLRAIKDDPISEGIVERFRAETIDAFGAWFPTAQSATGLSKPTSQAGRLVLPARQA